MKDVHNLLQSLEACGLTMSWAAGHLGVTRQAASHWALGRSTPGDQTRFKIRLLTAGLQKLEQSLTTVKNQ